MVDSKFKCRVDSFMLLAALRYSMGHSIALAIFRDNIKENLKELPNDVLTQIKEELIEYYINKQEDSDYLIAREIIIMIKRELFDDD